MLVTLVALVFPGLEKGAHLIPCFSAQAPLFPLDRHVTLLTLLTSKASLLFS
jgi:hypothetical protein